MFTTLFFESPMVEVACFFVIILCHFFFLFFFFKGFKGATTPCNEPNSILGGLNPKPPTVCFPPPNPVISNFNAAAKLGVLTKVLRPATGLEDGSCPNNGKINPGGDFGGLLGGDLILEPEEPPEGGEEIGELKELLKELVEEIIEDLALFDNELEANAEEIALEEGIELEIPEDLKLLKEETPLPLKLDLTNEVGLILPNSGNNLVAFPLGTKGFPPSKNVKVSIGILTPPKVVKNPLPV